MLIETLKSALADVFTFYLKAHNYHWNVEGPDFSQYHSLFSGIYEDVHGSVDGIAELIRTMDTFAPGTLSRMKELTNITEDTGIPDAIQMVKNLNNENMKVIAILMKAYQEAESSGELGISNYLQDRIQAHQKHGWMLRATLK